MKTVFQTTLLCSMALLSIQAGAQNSNATKTDESQVKKHIKMLKIEDGMKTELDTTITGDDDFMWFENFGFDDFDLCPDSVRKGKMNHFHDKFRAGEHRRPPMPPQFAKDQRGFEEMREFRFADGDSTHQRMVMIHRGNGDEAMMDFRGKPGMRMPMHSFQGVRHERMDNPNVIRLDSPEIISYKKKTMKDGTEKIEIVRKRPNPKAIKARTEVQVEDENNPQ